MGRRVKACAAGAALMVLAGCGHDAGAAFSVGDRSVSRATVNQVVDAACGVSQQSKTARSQQVWAFVNAMLNATVQNSYGDHAGSAYDGPALRNQLTQYDASIASLPTKERAVVKQFLTDQIRGALIVQSVGKQVLADRGVAKPTQAEITNVGNATAQKWARRQGIKVDPRYNPGPSHQAGAGDGSISTPVSSYAKAAAGGSTKQTYLAQLPADQLCG